ncbi:MAG: DUF2924 domain-containing protein [Sulfitobacter sp. SK025]|nr:MAG: DUF2924 domain-containing protein [Sulfitobacter sp. SK025]
MTGKPKPPPRKDLIEAWIEFYGSRPPKGLSTRLLHMACTYNDQVKRHGELKKRMLRDLLRYAKAPSGKTFSQNRSPKPSKLNTGTRLVREWRGQTHVVDIMNDGVHYNGETYKSLSQVARTITGTRWSGPRFFGV